jgi:uroporphyrinogen decarboxylase
MKSRGRVLKVLEHKEPDRIPIDMGSAVTSIHIEAYIKLKKCLGINKIKSRILNNMQQVVYD